MRKINIAILITCFNRKDKTLSCIKGLLSAAKKYNNEKMSFMIFLTDDGCTDGTAEALMQTFPDAPLKILNGDGSLFWAGGMRLAWNEALKNSTEWDYYLLLNDDVELLPNMFVSLFETEKYSVETFGQQGIYSGITRSISDPEKLTYGGHIFTNKLLNKSKHIWSDGSKPVMCDFTNANILMVPRTVVDKIGIFYEGYSHGFADYDYSMKARRYGIPVLLTKDICGACDFDHPSKVEEANKVKNMTLSKRKAYYSKPPHKISDFRRYILRNMPLRYPIVCISTIMNVYLPNLYYRCKGIK